MTTVLGDSSPKAKYGLVFAVLDRRRAGCLHPHPPRSQAPAAFPPLPRTSQPPRPRASPHRLLSQIFAGPYKTATVYTYAQAGADGLNFLGVLISLGG